MTESILAVSGVHKSYGKTKALNHVDIELRKGEFVALLGPNGAGKSTLFHLLTGLFVPDQGSIVIQGNDIRKAPVRALAGLGVVFQQATLDLDLSLRANLVYHCRLHGIYSPQARGRIADELERVGLANRAADKARSLSGGNRRKVELARALLHDPVILLMDEATVGLDPASRTSLVQYVLDRCNNGDVSVLWATHLVDEAEQAHRVLVLHQGKLIAQGTPDEIVGRTERTTLEDAFLELTGTHHS